MSGHVRDAGHVALRQRTFREAPRTAAVVGNRDVVGRTPGFRVFATDDDAVLCVAERDRENARGRCCRRVPECRRPSTFDRDRSNERRAPSRRRRCRSTRSMCPERPGRCHWPRTPLRPEASAARSRLARESTLRRHRPSLRENRRPSTGSLIAMPWSVVPERDRVEKHALLPRVELPRPVGAVVACGRSSPARCRRGRRPSATRASHWSVHVAKVEPRSARRPSRPSRSFRRRWCATNRPRVPLAQTTVGLRATRPRNSAFVPLVCGVHCAARDSGASKCERDEQ